MRVLRDGKIIEEPAHPAEAIVRGKSLSLTKLAAKLGVQESEITEATA